MVLNELQLSGFKWIDITDPTKEELVELAGREGLNRRLTVNCLSTEHLPHIKTDSSVQFIILRLIEPKSKINANSVQSLTTKVALFVTADKVISLHRIALRELDAIKAKITEKNPENVTKQQLLSYFYEQVALGFDEPLADLEQRLEKFEMRLFSKKKSKDFLQDGFYLKRKAAAFKKVLKLTLDLLGKFISKMECSPELFLDAKDRLERSLFYAEDVADNIQSLLSLHVSIESQKTNEASFKTNEIMRVLTVLTLFFLPLNFLVGLFGMNFSHIPLLQHSYGFWYSIVLMLVASILLAVYLFKRGWLAKPDITTESEINNSSK